MPLETLPNRRKRPRPEPLLRIYDARHGYLNVSALDALSSNGERCVQVKYQRDELGHLFISPAEYGCEDAFAVTRKGFVNVARIVELAPAGVTFPVTLRLVRDNGERRLRLAGRA